MKYYKESPQPDLLKYDVEFVHKGAPGSFYTVSPHIHTAIEILYMTEGEFKMDIGGYVAIVRPGDMVLTRSNVIHSVYRLDPNSGAYYVFKLASQDLFNIFKGCDDREYIMSFLRSSGGDKIIFRAEELSDEINFIWSRMIAEHDKCDEMLLPAEKAYGALLLIEIYKSFFRKPTSDAEDDAQNNRDMVALIQDSVEYINNNYSSDITATECAKLVNLSYSYYAKLFRTVVGKSFKEYLTAIRLAKAYNKMLISELSVTDIAFSCGYKSPSHFTAEFRKKFGITPSEARKSSVSNIIDAGTSEADI